MGEFELLARLRERLPPPGPGVVLGSGDDAAVTAPAGATATSIDSIVDGVHFRRSTFTLPQIGHKALAAALSDLAAMGARAGEAYVSLGAPDDLGDEELLEIADGLAELARRTATTIAGGDLTGSPVLSVTVAVVGHGAVPERFVTRAGARAGDLLVLTGALGGAAAGLALLEGADGPGLPEGEAARALRERQTAPQPRLDAGLALASGGATAMIDVSDGLAADAGHLAAASGVALVIEAGDLPLAPGLEEAAGWAGAEGLDLALGGGEDYELLAALGPEAAGAALTAVRATGIDATVIGRCREGGGVEVRLPGGGEARLPAGYDQLDRRR